MSNSKYEKIGLITGAVQDLSDPQLGILLDLARRFGKEDGDRWQGLIQEAVNKGLKPTSLYGDHLRLLSGSSPLVISATTDLRPIAERGDLFHSFLDNSFHNYGTAVKQVATKETPVEVFEMIKDGQFKDIYTIPNRPYDSLFLTQAQICAFISIHKKWLRTDRYATFFLFKEKVKGEDTFFVADVRVDSSRQLRASMYDLSDDRLRNAVCCHRFVIPQLKA